jgi:hypothetical protein
MTRKTGIEKPADLAQRLVAAALVHWPMHLVISGAYAAGGTPTSAPRTTTRCSAGYWTTATLPSPYQRTSAR